MYELIKISERDYYIDCPAKIGVVKISESDVVLIDSGSDKDAGKKILKAVDENGWTLKAIFNTHSHADHIGGNKLLSDRTGCKIYAPGIEQSYTVHTKLEPIGLYGGLPFKELENKFLVAQESPAELLTDDVLPKGFEIIDLSGHSPSMVGFKTPDGTVFVADSISSEETLSKYGIACMWDPAAALKALEFLKTVEGKAFVPAHAPVASDIKGLIDINISAIKSVQNFVLKVCENGKTFEEILKSLFDEYAMTMSAQQYALIGSTVRSYLSSMYSDGLLAFEFVENRMVWKSI